MSLVAFERDLRLVAIDDVADLRRLYRLALRGSGIEMVGEAGNGRDGVQEVLRWLPDLVLLDLSMPDFDGLEALLAIRRQAPQCRVLVLSGFTRERMGQPVLALGAMDYVEKGVHPDELVRRLKAAAARTPPPFREPSEEALEALRARMRELI